jgi:hypothetical protein
MGLAVTGKMFKMAATPNAADAAGVFSQVAASSREA